MSFPLSIRILLLICPGAVDVYLYLWQLFLYSEHFILPQFGHQISYSWKESGFIHAELGIFQVKLILGTE